MQAEESELDPLEASMNARLADAWEAGEPWARTDYLGCPVGSSAASSHRAALQKVLHQLAAAPGSNCMFM